MKKELIILFFLMISQLGFTQGGRAVVDVTDAGKVESYITGRNWESPPRDGDMGLYFSYDYSDITNNYCMIFWNTSTSKSDPAGVFINVEFFPSYSRCRFQGLSPHTGKSMYLYLYPDGHIETASGDIMFQTSDTENQVNTHYSEVKPKTEVKSQPIEKPKATIQPPSPVDWKKYSKTVPIENCLPNTSENNFFKTHYKEEFRDKAANRFLNYYDAKFHGTWDFNGLLDGQCDETELMAIWRGGQQKSKSGYYLHEMSAVNFLINRKLSNGKIRGEVFFDEDKLKFPNEVIDGFK